MRPVLAFVLTLSTPALAAQDLAPFEAATVFAGEQERFVKTADLDGDGLVEAVGWWQINDNYAAVAIHRMRGYRNDGTGRLVPTWSLDFTSPRFQWTPYFDAHESCEAADLDGDGDDDFVIAAGDHLDVWLSNGAQPPTLAISNPSPADIPWRSVALADFDLDGDIDLGATRGYMVELYDVNLAGGTLIGRSSRFGAGSPSRLLALDCTGDGHPDLVANGERIFPVEAGTIGDPVTHPHTWTFDSGYELRHDAGDVDGDGDIDVVTFRKHVSQTWHSYSILRRTGPGTFVRSAEQSGGPARRLFDVDGDGDLDGVCCGGGGGGIYMNRLPSTFRIALNDGTGNLAESLDVLGLGSTAIAGVADLDQDGRVDLVAGRCVWFQRQTIGGAPQPVIGTRELLDRTLADVDGDGDLDIEPRPWSVALNRGDAQFTLAAIPLPPPPVGHRNGEGHWADWDGDGDQDCLVNIVAVGMNVGMELVRNHGNGSYVSAGMVADDPNATGFNLLSDDGLAVDVDGDGDLDLVRRNVSVASAPRSGWWRNEGSSFTFREIWEGATILHVGDFDGDAVGDLLSLRTAGLELAHGIGGGVFLPFVLFASVQADFHGNGVDVDDIDADGDQDIVVADRLPGSGSPPRSLRLFQNDGSGVFTVVTLVDAGLHSTSPSSVRILDVDLDGRLDVVAAPALETLHAALVLRARSDGTGFEPPIVQMLFHAPAGSPGSPPPFPRFGAGDIDGDGDIDLLTNRLLQNRAHHGETRGIHVQNGAGTPGSGGIRPLLGADGPFRVGEQVRIHLRAAAPGSTGFMRTSLVAGIPPPSFDPGTVAATRARIHAQAPFTTTGTNGGSAGTGTWELPFTVPAYTLGQTRMYVAFVDDLGTMAGFARSNALYVVYGP